MKKIPLDSHGKVRIVETSSVRSEAARPRAEDPVKVQELSLRDGYQSLFATRGRTEDMLAVAEAMDRVGFHSIEVWGGATFDTAHRYLNEDPWERLRALKKSFRRTPLSMLLRGQNLVGYRNYPDDVVEAFVQRACDNGIDIFRVFDALNDFRNFETAVKVIKKNKKHFQGSFCYSLTEMRMGGEVYNLDYYLEKARQLEDMGADTICIKDMAGIVAPYDAYNLIAAMKSRTRLPIHLHTHFSSGMGDLALLKAIEAGVDIIDACMGPFAYRSSHPAVEPLVVSLLGTNRDPGFDIRLLAQIDEEMEKQVARYMQFANQTRYSVIDVDVVLHQTPGGMLSNLVSQLRDMNELSKLDEVFKALPTIRRELGQPPLVTPTSQIVGIQAVNNVLFDTEGERYTRITEQTRDLCYGLYGQTPRPIDAKVREKALRDYPRGQKPIVGRPGDILAPELEKARKEIGDLAKDMDDLLIYALFPVTGKRFLRIKYGLEKPPMEPKHDITQDKGGAAPALASAPAPGAAGTTTAGAAPSNGGPSRVFDIQVDGQLFRVQVKEVGAQDAAPLPLGAAAASPAAASPPAAPAAAASAPPAPTSTAASPSIAADQKLESLKAPIAGMIVELSKKPGEPVKKGDSVMILEAMKMHNHIESAIDGEIVEYRVAQGDTVAKGQVLCLIRPKS